MNKILEGCMEYGCDFDEYTGEVIRHRNGCPHATPVASNIADFNLARADRGTKPREHAVEDALDLARAWMKECGPENQPDHIIVFLGRTNRDNSSGTKYFQTGTFSSHAQVGLVYEGLDMLRHSGDK